jgi:hypothetical protein
MVLDLSCGPGIGGTHRLQTQVTSAYNSNGDTRSDSDVEEGFHGELIS